MIPALAYPAHVWRRLAKSFWFTPAVMAVCGIALAFALVAIDRADFDLLAPGEGPLRIGPESARSVLSTIATASMTVASLVYSITLVVFTLAAGNIGPRLVETFTGSRINQTTMGAFLATFLYALVVLYLIGPNEAPSIAVAFAILLALASFGCLLSFVHQAARRVFVDNEVARLAGAFEAHLSRLDTAEDAGAADGPPASGPVHAVPATRTGYVQSIDMAALCACARQAGGQVALHLKPGDYALAGMPALDLHAAAAPEPAARETLAAAFVTAPTRTGEEDLEFHFRLMVEIAARALSPGINDFYTALTCIDHLSGALCAFLRHGPPPRLLRDANGAIRVFCQRTTFERLLGEAVHPIRQAAGHNALVSIRLIGALKRILPVAAPDERAMVVEQALLVREHAWAALRMPADRRAVAQAFAGLRAEAESLAQQ